MGGLNTEQDLAKVLAAAAERYAAEERDSNSSTEAIANGLHDLLYGYGGDGVLELSVSQPTSSRCLTVLGIVIWVEEQTQSPLEAVFQFDDVGAVSALTLRAGDRRIAPRDMPGYQESWRNLLRIIAARPTADEDWTYVLQYEFG
jgi:hypothetical protein